MFWREIVAIHSEITSKYNTQIKQAAYIHVVSVLQSVTTEVKYQVYLENSMLLYWFSD